jgi:CheY-like chemotaxis protein
MLDLLVQERCETLRATSTTLAREAESPLEELARAAREIEARANDETSRAFAKRLMENIMRVDELLKNAGSAQRGILGAEEFMRTFSREGQVDPLFAGRRVLVADDDETTRETVRDVFVQQGCEVTACIDGRAAIDAVRARAAAATPFDLVISDIRMPDANGYEVFRASKDASLGTAVILMTGFGYDPNHSIVRSGQEGLHCHLFKPIEIAQLLEESRKALAARG